MILKNYLLTLCCFVLIISCKRKTPKTDNLFKFKNYISYTTNGRVSITNPLVIKLQKNVEHWELDTPIASNILTIYPSVSGRLVLKNKRTLIFYPDKNLNPNMEYRVSLDLKSCYHDIPEPYSKYTFQFKTIAPNFTVNTSSIQSYSKEWQYITGEVKTSDKYALKQVKKLMQAFQNNKKLQIVWDESLNENTVFNFKIDSIKRKIEEDKVLVRWDGKAIQADNFGENTISISGKNNFKIINAYIQQNPEQCIVINFSDILKSNQNFDGLVSIKNTANPKFIVDGMLLKVFPEKKISGNVVVEVFPGVKNSENYKLKNGFLETFSFKQLKPQVRLINSGVILPNSKELKFNFEAVNLKAVDVRVIKIFQNNILQFLQDENLKSNNKRQIRRVGRRIAKKTIELVNKIQTNTGQWKSYSVDLSKLITSDPGAVYRVELSYKKSYSLYNCDVSNSDDFNDKEEDYYDEYDNYYEDTTVYRESTSENEELREEEYWDNIIYNYRKDNYNWQERNNPCHEAYYNQNRIVAQNVMSSNLGVIAKQGSNNRYYFAVTNILTTSPEANASIRLYNFQQQQIAQLTTNPEGLAFSKLTKQAAFAIASKQGHTTYLKLNDGNSLSLSKFDVSGHKLQRGLKGFIYGERGVWRPGDSLHLNFILNDKNNPIPNEHPVKMEVFDAQRKLIYKKITSTHLNKFYRFTVPTSIEDKTGNWQAKVTVGGAVFYKSLKVETVKPNRLKIKIDFTDHTLSNKRPLYGNLKVNWLHGAPAKHIKAEVKAKFTLAKTSFNAYKAYRFTDPSRIFSTEEITVFEGQVNADGVAKINSELKVGKGAPGMLNAQFLVRAFENGGDFSIDAFTKPYAPYSTFVGLKSPKSQAYGSYFTDANQTFEVVTVNASGKPIKRNGLEVKIYKIEWRWWWNASYENLSKYTSSKYHKPYKSFTVNTNANGKAQFNLNIPEKDNGRYLIRIIDPKGGHATGRTAYFYRNWWHFQPNEDKEAAKMLVFTANKAVYNVNETAKISFPSDTNSRALISVENGAEVLSQFWVKTEDKNTKVTIPITPEMAPNVFVNISLLQPHASIKNDLPIRLYGVIPLSVENPDTKLEPEIRMPSILEPQKEFTVFVSEKNNKPMTYTLAIVEEGLLDLTRFKTPNAWNAFYKREALGVKTWDVFDDVIGAYSGSIEQVFAIGGDGNLTKAKNKKANRFKPVVKFLGPFTIKASGRKSHTITLPNYIGAVKTMVVAGNPKTEAFGSSEKSVQVKKPLMVLASLPRKLSPGEAVTLPVTVFVTEPNIKNVSLKLKLSHGISVKGPSTKTVSFDKPDEKMVFFNLDASQAKGVTKITVVATGHGEVATYDVPIHVENPNPISSKLYSLDVQAKQNKNIDFKTFGVLGTNTAVVEFSTLPPMDFTSRLQYLIRYPHGCVEQTTSSVFPQLFLTDIFDMPYSKKQEVQENIKNGIKRIGNFQHSNGGLSYWIGERVTSDWGTSYAGHFMIEAENKGFVLPLTFKSSWIKYQKQAARNWRPSYKKYNSDLAQAYRLYTLALAGSAELALMNRLREFPQLSNNAKWRLAAAYALIGQNEASKAVSATANIEFEAKADRYTYGSVNRNRAMALETMVITKDKRGPTLAKSIAKALSSSSWMSTQTTAYSLLAMSKMVVENGGKSIALNYSINGKTERIETNKAIVQRTLDINAGANSLSIKNNQDNVVFINVLSSGKLPLGGEVFEQRGLDISQVYKDLKGNTIAIENLKQGEDFVATIQVNNTTNNAVNDVALTQIFPSGWEIVNTRFTDFGDQTTNDARYTDIRDDRVHFYFNLNKKDTKTFNVMLNASYLGRYYLPGLQAEAMYDNDYFVRTKGQWVNITRE